MAYVPWTNAADWLNNYQNNEGVGYGDLGSLVDVFGQGSDWAMQGGDGTSENPGSLQLTPEAYQRLSQYQMSEGGLDEDANRRYYDVTGPGGYSSRVWEKINDESWIDKAFPGLLMAGMGAGLMGLLPGTTSLFGSAGGAASGGLTGVDAAMADMAASTASAGSGIEGASGLGSLFSAPGTTSVQGALNELVGQSMLPSAATMSPELAAGLGELTGQSLVTGAAAVPGLESLSSAAAYDPVAAYYNTGASEGSTMGNAWSGAGGEAGAVGEGSFAGTLADMGPLGGAIDSLGGMLGGSSPIIGPGVNFMNNLPLPENFKKILGKVFSGGKTFNTAKGLAQLYSGYRGMRDNEKMLSGLQGLYSQNSPYAQNLRKQLQRQDAASGRRSQYGPREVELQAKLAQLASGQIPAMNQMYQQQALARNMMLQGGLGLLFGRGG